MIRALVRAWRQHREAKRERILPMPDGSLFERCGRLCGWITARPGSALR